MILLRRLSLRVWNLWTHAPGWGKAAMIVVALVTWPITFFVLAVALAYEVIARGDRDGRLPVTGHWALATVVMAAIFVGVNSLTVSARTEPRPDGLDPVGSPSIAMSRESPTGTTAAPTAIPTPTATAAPTATATPTRAATPSPTRTPATPVPTPTTEAAVELGAAPVGPTETATVVRVVDGDTIVVDRGRGPEKVRYIGMDTPETVDPDSPVGWMGPEASAANEALVDGKTVLLERDVSETDRYGRLLRYVWVEDAEQPSGWLLVNAALVADGFAQVSTYPPDVAYADLYLDLQRKAETAGLGLWSPAADPSPDAEATPKPTAKPTAKPTPRPTPKPTPRPTPRRTPKPTVRASSCHPSYEGACLKEGIGDYDCAGGSGNGPNYVEGPVRVVGYDEFGLDRDHDGVGCE